MSNGLATADVASVELTTVAPAPVVRRVHVCINAEEVLLLRQPHPDMSVRTPFPAVVQWLTHEGRWCALDSTAVSNFRL
ncbi:MAG: hypothetical protein AB7U20_04990 [Planctomycetaceae bacterium]